MILPPVALLVSICILPYAVPLFIVLPFFDACGAFFLIGIVIILRISAFFPDEANKMYIRTSYISHCGLCKSAFLLLAFNVSYHFHMFLRYY